MQQGTLRRNATGNFSFEWSEPKFLKSRLAYQNRSMELSALEFYNNKLLAFCDRSGLVFEINVADGGAIPKTVLFRRGDKYGLLPPYKSEWATVKGKTLYIGSFGKEWVENGVQTHSDLLWIKTMTKEGSVEDVDWESAFHKVRAHANATYPGYMVHEAVAWDHHSGNWLFLPRKLSQTKPYDASTDEMMGGNTLFILSEDFKTVRSVAIGPLEADWGFSEIKVLPQPMQKKGARNVSLVLGVKVKEVDDVTDSKVAVFDTEGNFYTDPIFLPLGLNPAGTKFEGLAFIE